MYAVVKIGSMMRKSECITAVTVLASAIEHTVSAAESASADSVIFDALVGRFQWEIWNIRLSPDVKLVKARSPVEHAVRYLGALTRCKSKVFEICTKRDARQSSFGPSPDCVRRLSTRAVCTL